MYASKRGIWHIHRSANLAAATVTEAILGCMFQDLFLCSDSLSAVRRTQWRTLDSYLRMPTRFNAQYHWLLEESLASEY